LITVDLLRHGELEGGVKYRGLVDDPLTATGRTAMNSVWAEVKPEIDLIVSSPLSRCLGPTSEWAKQAGIECISDERIAEMHYGEWEGLTSGEIMTRYPGILERWRTNPERVQVPGGESVFQLRDRIAEFWSDLCKAHDGKHLLVVAHSGSLRMLIAHVLNAPIIATRHMQMPYACWSRISHHNENSQLMFHNRDF
jgi:alpha-ribazole phosphatase/probable phosphoglycerate mutase